MSWKDIPIPESMQHLPKDKRGFPIPFIVQRDVDGNPHFTINDTAKVMFTAMHGLCTISGLPLHRGKWLVGGPMSAFHRNGAYADGPVRYECLEYALQVCPYLAARSYTKRIDDVKFDYEKNPNIAGLLDSTVLPDRPDLFVAVMVTDIRVSQTPQGLLHYHPKRPYLNVEYWKDGKKLSEDDGKRLVLDSFPEVDPVLRQPKIVSRKPAPKKPW